MPQRLELPNQVNYPDASTQANYLSVSPFILTNRSNESSGSAACSFFFPGKRATPPWDLCGQTSSDHIVRCTSSLGQITKIYHHWVRQCCWRRLLNLVQANVRRSWNYPPWYKAVWYHKCDVAIKVYQFFCPVSYLHTTHAFTNRITS